jgi:hypothetical protein
VRETEEEEEEGRTTTTTQKNENENENKSDKATRRSIFGRGNLLWGVEAGTNWLQRKKNTS